ncbi:hypothetical protein BGX20_011109 [Mortierella sp. AD010]|nr:hypothetical protein BGX20_011109 [Mortierella sp. AD010]
MLSVPQSEIEALSMQDNKTQTQAQPIPQPTTRAQPIPQSTTHRQYHPQDQLHHSDPRELMPTLQIQVTDHSQQSKSIYSEQSLSSSWPNESTSILNSDSISDNKLQTFQSHQSYQDGMPPTSTSLTSASGHLAVPEKNRSSSKRWSLTGRFFGDRRKSASEPSQTPNDPNNGQDSSNKEGLSSNSNSGSGFSSIIRTRSRSGSGSSNGGKNYSTSSRSSLADFSRSFLSSMRRASSVSDPPPSSNNGNHSAMAAATAAVSASIAAAIGSPKHATGLYYSSGGEDGDDDMGSDSVYNTVQRGWIDENRYVAMATPKGPPMDPLTLSKRPPPKSILKKQSHNGSSGDNSGVNASATTIVAPVPSVARTSSTVPSILESDVHPMAPVDENSPDSKPFTLPTDHRAKLVTNSPPPPPTHLEEEPTSPPDDSDSELVNPLDDLLLREHSKDSSSSSSDSGNSNSSNSRSKTQDSYSSQKGASTPSDYRPGLQSNQAYRSRGDDISQAEMLNDEMMNVGARAQDLARQYYGYGSATSGRGGFQQGVSTAADMNGGRGTGARRSIAFHDRIEVIPVYRKADYNRQSDKNVTFKVLTPEMRCDIRDELNNYKMREMAVHVDSMTNTAFH